MGEPEALPAFRCDSLEEAALAFQDMHRAAMAFATELADLRAKLAAAEARAEQAEAGAAKIRAALDAVVNPMMDGTYGAAVEAARIALASPVGSALLAELEAARRVCETAEVLDNSLAPAVDESVAMRAALAAWRKAAGK